MSLLRLEDWSSRLPGQVIDLEARHALLELTERYSSNEQVLSAVLAHARRLDAKTGLLEYRYIDRDYRSEYSAFYAGSYRRLPSITHRLHFFEQSLPPDFLSSGEPSNFRNLTYLGYVVLRPVQAAPVGRTMLPPDPGTRPALTCLTTETVNVFGYDFQVTGMPFIAQDAHFGVCAHADAWMVAFYHHLRFRHAPRRTPADFVRGLNNDDTPFPLAPAGITYSQLVNALRDANLPSLVYPVADLEKGQHISEFACRYLDSGLPCILVGKSHTVTLIGYRRTATFMGRGKPKIEFLTHDDETGPYVQFGGTGIRRYEPWNRLIVPLPEKLWMPAEMAEVLGRQRANIELGRSEVGKRVLARIEAKELTWRTVAVESSEFKTSLASRGANPDLVAHYSRLSMPRWIWVVELTERASANPGSVVGELIIDSTSHMRDNHVLCWRLPTEFMHWNPDTNQQIPATIPVNDALSPLRPYGRLRLVGDGSDAVLVAERPEPASTQVTP